MTDPNLIEYIKKTLAQGHPEDVIKQNLLANGWAESDVKQAFDLIKLQTEVPTPPPVQSVPHHTKKITKPSVNSAYSTLLAVALFVFLIIFVNNILSDVNSYFKSDITGQLIVNALITIPFLIIAFFLHLSFGQHNEKYKILSQPYYLASGWLLIRLLWKVSQFLFDKTSTYGVYFVLILIVLVLSVIIFFVQKHLKKAND